MEVKRRNDLVSSHFRLPPNAPSELATIVTDKATTLN
jgi:hypothetical protein